MLHAVRRPLAINLVCNNFSSFAGQTDVTIGVVKTPPSTSTLRLSPPSRPAAGSDSEDDDYHEYTQPDWPVGSPVGAVVHTLPQQVPQRKHAKTLPRGPVSCGSSFGKKDTTVLGKSYPLCLALKTKGRRERKCVCCLLS